MKAVQVHLICINIFNYTYLFIHMNNTAKHKSLRIGTRKLRRGGIILAPQEEAEM